MNISTYQVSDSFHLTAPATATGVNFGAWDVAVVSVDWSIGTSFGGSDIASGTASVTDVLNNVVILSHFDRSVYSASFSLPDVSLASGTTYYLSLQNAGSNVWWDINYGAGPDGGGITYELIAPDGTVFIPPGAESFQILGTFSAVPEPATFALFGTGLLAGGILRRKSGSALEPPGQRGRVR